MIFDVVKKSTTVNRFVFYTLQRNITHLAVITRKTNIKLGFLKRGELEKSRIFLYHSKSIVALSLNLKRYFTCDQFS